MSRRSENSVARPVPLGFLSVGECVSVDSIRRRVYISVRNGLNEVDFAGHLAGEIRVVNIFHAPNSVSLTLVTTLSLDIRFQTTDCERRGRDRIALREGVPTHRTSWPTILLSSSRARASGSVNGDAFCVSSDLSDQQATWQPHLLEYQKRIIMLSGQGLGRSFS